MKRSHNDALINAPNKQTKQEENALITVPRTSDLMAPIVRLDGHRGTVHSCRFNANGDRLVTAGAGGEILLWNVFGDTCNYGVITGHKHTVQECVWSHDSCFLASASADKTVKWWDAESGELIRSFSEHNSFVNAVASSNTSPHLVASGGDDKTVKIWDATRSKKSTQTLRHPHEVLSVKFSSKQLHENIVFSGCVDGIVRAFDLRKEACLFELVPSKGTMCTGLSIVGTTLFAYYTNGEIKEWDTSYFVAKDRLRKSYVPQLRLNSDLLLLRCAASTSRVAAGSSDYNVCIWNTNAPEKLAFQLPGHRGPVLDVDLHPSQNIVVSCSSDKLVYLGELNQ